MMINKNLWRLVLYGSESYTIAKAEENRGLGEGRRNSAGENIRHMRKYIRKRRNL